MSVSKTKTKIPIWHHLPIADVSKILDVNCERGLGMDEVLKRQKLGRNALPEAKPVSRLRIVLSQFKSPLIYILIVAGGVTLFLREYTDAIVILAAVFVNAIVGYVQEFKASNTLRELKKILRVKAIVIRDGKEKEIFQEDLVKGDIVILKSGSKVPADARIIKSWNLKIQEAPLTGEWLGAEKVLKVLDEKTPLADRDNMAYMGTIVEDGEGRAIVTGIGSHTEIGKVAKLIGETKEEKTPYQKRLSHFSKIVGALVAGASILIFIEGVLTQRPFVEMFVTAVAVAVAAIPEGLPIAMTIILAIGMQRILKKKGLVRKLASAETLGSTSIIATDKTLTLTQGKMQMDIVKAEDVKLALQIAVLANEAFIENSGEAFRSWKIKGDPTSRALIEAAGEQGIFKPELEKTFHKISGIPFNTQNKFITSFYRKQGSVVAYVSGAPEKIISLSTKVKGKTRQSQFTKATASHLEKELEELTGRGLRVVAVAYKSLKGVKNVANNELGLDDVSDLTFVGFIGLKDPIRKEAKKAFGICRKAGMRTIIVTGDHMLTAKAVAEELDLPTKKENMMLGSELEELSETQLGKKLNSINVFARVEPKHKLRIIEAWQKKNHVVAMTGDGINDAAALKKADIGVALGSGTDVARDVSDIVLLDDNFSVLVAAVEEGRAILDNIRKVITYLLSDSFTEMILIGVAILFRLPLPITAVQILWVNLIEDGLPNIALAFEEKEKDLMKQKPIAHGSPLLTREMKIIIFAIGVITDFILLGLFLWLYYSIGVVGLGYIRTMIFAGLTIDSLFYVFSCKSLRRNIWHINIFSNKLLVISWVLGWVFLLGGVYLPIFQNLLKTVPLGRFDWLILSGLGLTKLLLIEATKYYFIVRHKTEV
ncbi:MAG: HAD-IC family P-type ATPase [Parcubacteria group bacterium]|nr:HAD-IC family P-type ATPase [Parcubacteria group bacterium]